MRDFFIQWAERLLLVFVLTALIAVVFGALAVMARTGPEGGFLAGLLVLVMGSIYVTVMAGLMFVAFGIYRNGQETNRLLRERR